MTGSPGLERGRIGRRECADAASGLKRNPGWADRAGVQEQAICIGDQTVLILTTPMWTYGSRLGFPGHRPPAVLIQSETRCTTTLSIPR
jgi:hypothetical protein